MERRSFVARMCAMLGVGVAGTAIAAPRMTSEQILDFGGEGGLLTCVTKVKPECDLAIAEWRDFLKYEHGRALGVRVSSMAKMEVSDIQANGLRTSTSSVYIFTDEQVAEIIRRARL